MIQLAAVTKVFRSGRGEVAALQDISFVIRKGAFGAVIGRSGSGKSTLLYCIGGLEPPDRGRIICFGKPIYAMKPCELDMFRRKHVGIVFQRGNLLSYLTVGENIGFPLILNGVAGSERSKRVDELLDGIGLAAAAKALPHELSGGETQRVALARAIANRPAILLADEPTANLDSENGLQVVQLMRNLGRDYGCTILLATHDVDIIANAAPVIRLEDGRVRENE